MRDIIGERSVDAPRPPNHMPITEAMMAVKKCNKCGCTKPFSEFNKHCRSKDGLQYWCKPCLRAAVAANVKKDPQAQIERQKRWVAANKKHLSDFNKAWRKQNPEKALAHYARSEANRDKAKRKAWAAENRKKLNANAAEWRKRNPAQCRTFEAKRRAAEVRAIPPWANQDEILQFYRQAQEKGLTVDHIVPLRSRLVCGLHCAANLQLLSGSENSIKSNRHWPDMP